MNWSTIQNGIKDWAEDATGLTAVWMNQARPITTKPFVILQIISTSKEGLDYYEYEFTDASPDDYLLPTIHGYRLLTVQVTVVSRNQNAGYDAINYLELARTRLNRPVLQTALRAAGLEINWTSQAILMRDVVFDNRWESRCVMDIVFRAVQTDAFTDSADQESFIERAEVSSDIDGADDAIELDDEIIGIPV